MPMPPWTCTAPLGDSTGIFANSGLGGGDGTRAIGSSSFRLAIRLADCALLLGDIHVDHVMLQHLELADGLAELLAGLGVFDRGGHQHGDSTGGFRQMRRDSAIDKFLERWQRCPFLTESAAPARFQR